MQNAALSLSEAYAVIANAKPQARNLNVVEWLVRADLLIEDAPFTGTGYDDENVVRPAFERLGDFLVAAEVLEQAKKTGFDIACQTGGAIHALLADSDKLARNTGVLAALSILLPEAQADTELPDLIADETVHTELLRITVEAFASRDPASFGIATESLLREALGSAEVSYQAMDALLSVSWQPSVIDALWLDALLKRQALAERDGYWCGYLHHSYEEQDIVHRLIKAAFDLPLPQIEAETAERWAIVLLWFTAAADRRVKDQATRAVTALLVAQTSILPDVLPRLLDTDDDEVKERALLSAYGALILSRDAEMTKAITTLLQAVYRREPARFDEVLHFEPNGFVSDFYAYSMDCLRPWLDTVSKQDMGRWILQRATLEFGYENSGCEDYDRYMLGKYGGGRGKPAWPERIGKKYQWLALFQLASRLHDHVPRRQDDWEPEPLRTPLILLEERKHDPTLSARQVAKLEELPNEWWLAASAYLASTEPDSKGRQETFKEEAETAKVHQDADVLAAAQRLLEQLNAQPGGPEMVQQIVNGNENIFSGTGDVNVTITRK